MHTISHECGHPVLNIFNLVDYYVLLNINYFNLISLLNFIGFLHILFNLRLYCLLTLLKYRVSGGRFIFSNLNKKHNN